jgi:hypothetical protein
MSEGYSHEQHIEAIGVGARTKVPALHCESFQERSLGVYLCSEDFLALNCEL